MKSVNETMQNILVTAAVLILFGPIHRKTVANYANISLGLIKFPYCVELELKYECGSRHQ